MALGFARIIMPTHGVKEGSRVEVLSFAYLNGRLMVIFRCDDGHVRDCEARAIRMLPHVADEAVAA